MEIPEGSESATRTAQGEPVPEELREKLQAQLALVYDAQGRLSHATPAFEKLFGYDCRPEMGRVPPHPWWPEEDRARMREVSWFISSGAARRLGITSVTLRMRRADGVLLTGTAECHEFSAPGSGSLLHVVRFRLADVSIEASSSDLLAGIHTICSQMSDAIAQLGARLDAMEGRRAKRKKTLAGLSGREREVLDALIDGQRAGQIAHKLCISPHTARNHMRSVFRKVGVRSHVELLRCMGPTTDDFEADRAGATS